MAEAAQTVLVGLLRGFALWAGRERIPLVWTAQRLVAYLAIGARPIGRSHVAGALWPEASARRAGANLRSALWRANQAYDGLILASPQQLALRPNVAVDLWIAMARANLLIDGAAACDDEILSAATRADLSAELLPDWYDDDWVLVEREQYRQLRLHALEALCERLLRSERYGEAIDAGVAAVRAEPLRESAHRTLIRAHLAEGNRWEAMRQYERCRRLLLEELGVEPLDSLLDLLPVSTPPGVGSPAWPQAVHGYAR